MNTKELEESEFELTESEELMELIFSENTTIPEIITGLRQYVAINGTDLKPLAAAIKQVMVYFVGMSLDDDFDSLADPNLLATLTSTLEPEKRPEFYPYKMTEGNYSLKTDVSLTEFKRLHYMTCKIYLPEQVAAEFQRNITRDGSNICHGHSFETKIAVQIYNDYRDIIIDANATPDANSILEFYGIIVNAIAAGASDEKISAFFKIVEAESDATSAPRPCLN